MSKRIKSFDTYVFESKADSLLNYGSPYRSWAVPDEDWSYYQEWNRTIFMHWEIPYNDLSPLIPSELEIDSFNDKCWISIVPFTMENVRPAYVFSFSPISNFHEINVRTYVNYKGKPGVYFINIEAQKAVSVFLSKLISDLPYEKSEIVRGENFYRSNNSNKGFNLDIEYQIGPKITKKDPLTIWLTERYALFLEKEGEIYGCDIQHPEWILNQITLKEFDINYSIGRININSEPDLIQYSPGVNVLAWDIKKV